MKKYKNRKALLQAYKTKNEKLKVLEREILELKIQNLFINDDIYTYKEEIEYHPKRKYQRKENFLNNKLVGRVYWDEHFVDEDTEEVITITRNIIVKIEGEIDMTSVNFLFDRFNKLV